MNTHKLTNKEGKSIEFDSERFPAYMEMAAKGDGCGGFSCGDCPAYKNIDLDDSPYQKCFKDLTLTEIAKTYNLLELEEGEEYSCDESDNTVFCRMGDALRFKDVNSTMPWQTATLVFNHKTFRKIEKKKLTFADLKTNEVIMTDHGDPIEVVFLTFHKEKAVFGYANNDSVVSKKESSIANWRIR